MTIANGATVIGSNVSVQSADIILVTDPGTVFTNSGFLSLGNAPVSQPAGQFGALIISNAASVFSAAGSVGSQYWNGSTPPDSNTVLITGSGSRWIISGTLTNGGSTGPAGTNNSVTVANGAGLVSSNAFVGGGVALGGSNNFVVVTDAGSSWTNLGPLTVGNFARFSALYVTNGAALIVSNAAGAGLLPVGANGSVFNTVTFSNATIASQGLTIGSNSSSNTVTVLGGTTWNLLGSNVTIGTGTSTGNVLVVTGGTVSNAGLITVGANGAAGSVLTVTNGATIRSVGLTVGGNNASNNTVNMTDVTSRWDLGGGVLTIGSANGTAANGATGTTGMAVSGFTP